MKKFFLTAALVAAVASPALAATSHHLRNSAAPYAEGAYAAADGTYAYGQLDADTVVSDGKVLGRDPDSFIRFSLLREGDQTLQAGGGN